MTRLRAPVERRVRPTAHSVTRRPLSKARRESSMSQTFAASQANEAAQQRHLAQRRGESPCEVTLCNNTSCANAYKTRQESTDGANFAPCVEFADADFAWGEFVDAAPPMRQNDLFPLV